MPIPNSDLIDALPQPGDLWLPRRKARVVNAILSGELKLNEACQRYQLSTEEFESWAAAYERYGVPGLRATRVQIYRATRRAGGTGDGRSATAAAILYR